MNTHPLLGIDLSKYRVIDFPATVEIQDIATRKVAWIRKPYSHQNKEWWINQAQKAVAKMAR